jgi:hypothetical protein
LCLGLALLRLRIQLLLDVCLITLAGLRAFGFLVAFALASE